MTDKPVLIVDAALHRTKSLSRRITGDAAYRVGLGDRDLASVATHVDVERLHLYEVRGINLARVDRRRGSSISRSTGARS